MKQGRFSGNANKTGFRITDHTHKITVKTKGYQKPPWWLREPNNPRIFLPILFLVLAVLFGWSSFTKLLLPFFSAHFSFLVAVCLSTLISLIITVLALLIVLVVATFETRILEWSLSRYKEEYPKEFEELSQYHACEHKLVHLLENGEPATLEALQKTPSIHERCSTRLIFKALSLQEETLSEPSSEKLEETLEVAKEYFQKLSKSP